MQPTTERGRRVGKDPGGRQAEQTCYRISNRLKSLIKMIFSIAGWLTVKFFVAHSLNNPRRALTSHTWCGEEPTRGVGPACNLPHRSVLSRQNAAVWGRGFIDQRITSLLKFVTHFGISQEKKTFIYFLEKQKPNFCFSLKCHVVLVKSLPLQW